MTPADRDDDLFDLAIRGSAGGRIISRAAAATSAAWSTSVSRRGVTAAAERWSELTPPTRIRMAALAGAVAVAVQRAMSWLGPAEPLGAVLPSIVLGACAVAAAMAGPIATMSERFRQ
jgi:hypothetical protein